MQHPLITLKEKSFLDKVKLFFKMKIYSYSDLIISNSKSSAKKIKEKLKTKRRIISIPNPISKLETRINKTQKKDQILYVGRLSNEKGLFKLIEGFQIFNKDFPYYKLKIVGDGNQK